MKVYITRHKYYCADYPHHFLQIELATNEFPYSKWQTPFEQIKQVVMEDPPKLPPGRFTPEFEDFIIKW